MQGIIVALSASAVAFAVLYLVLTRRIRKLLDPEAILAQIRREVEELVVELNHTTERNISLMEDKLAALSSALEGAEKRVAVLRREAVALEQSERAYATLRPPPAPERDASAPFSAGAPEAHPAGSPRAAGSRPRRSRRAEASGASPPRPQRAPRAASRASRSAPDEGEALEHGGDGQDVRRHIVELHRAGISAESIARRVSVPRAQVELIVSLEEGSL